VSDIVDENTRSRMMAGIRGANTRPELAIRKALHARGFRYRLHVKGLAGRPDFILPKHRAAVFVHGCFWHRHEECRYATTPSTRREFWLTKFEANVKRDINARNSLLESGWRIATVWECALRKPEQVATTTDRLTTWLLSDAILIEIGENAIDRSLPPS
jgi:DNA mismatch endonuclease (patch repair protein)